MLLEQMLELYPPAPKDIFDHYQEPTTLGTVHSAMMGVFAASSIL